MGSSTYTTSPRASAAYLEMPIVAVLESGESSTHSWSLEYLLACAVGVVLVAFDGR